MYEIEGFEVDGAEVAHTCNLLLLLEGLEVGDEMRVAVEEDPGEEMALVGQLRLCFVQVQLCMRGEIHLARVLAWARILTWSLVAPLASAGFD